MVKNVGNKTRAVKPGARGDTTGLVTETFQRAREINEVKWPGIAGFKMGKVLQLIGRGLALMPAPAAKQ